MLELAGVAVEAVSVAGVQTCIQLPGFGLCFDMGICPPRAVKHPLVLFTHAHVDHMAGVIAHCATRRLQGMSPPTYVMPERNVADFHALLDVWRRLDGSDFLCDVIGLPPGQPLPLKKGIVARAVATPHRVVSQGYILSQTKQKLRPDLVGVPGQELRDRRAAGEQITHTVSDDVVAFTGDSRIEVIETDPAFRKARLLIMEVTFIDDRVSVEKTRDKGHIHLDEVIDRADLFENEAILFTHLSARYAPHKARALIDARLPPSLLQKVTLLASP